MSSSGNNRPGPLSVEDALRIKREKAEPERPVFLSKAQRAQMALERKQRETDEMRSHREAEVREMRAGTQNEHLAASRRNVSRSDSRSDSRSRHDRSDSRSRRSRSPTNRSRNRSPAHRSRNHRDSSSRRAPDRTRALSRSKSPARASEEFSVIGRQSTDGTGDRVLTDLEREAIRQRYTSGLRTEQPTRRQGGRRVMFDWDAREDTSQDISDLYQSRRNDARSMLFGRAQLGGAAERVGSKNGAFSDERHWSDKPLSEMRDRDWRIFKEDFSISCKGGRIPHPYRSWSESNIPKAILRVVEDIGYREPTPIQRQAIPIGFQNRDLIGIAETGSGKTASFLIPMLSFIMTQPRLNERNMMDGPYALILAPTRELVLQIEAEAHKFARRLGFRCVSIVGGHDIERQSFALRNGAEIIIATPGRLRDCIDRRVLVLNQCTYVVMDEADRMVDMGFEDDVNFILDALPVSNVKPENYDGSDDDDVVMGDDIEARFKYRQTTMFSATMPPVVERMARKYLRKPATVTIGVAGKAVDTVEQRVEFIAGEDKRKQRLLALLNQSGNAPPIIVFANLKKNVDMLGAALTRAHYSVATLHGGKTQEQREQALLRLRTGDAAVLVATDVAGRGIDVKDVSLVVNFDMAKDIESYTHRIGRTGRAGKKGLAVTFLGPDDRDVLYDLRKMIAASPLSRCPHELASHEAAQAPPALVKSAARKQQR
ncbi:mRNA splicing protein prp28 [Coemansia sp. RSA 353]|nr:mRNA splicing protein prp28 [Coemansia sp. RSA 788]KAJ2144541.1 mRNA splicing protein prp28 [Coemansia sp. RSA 564]KAJ2167588.1 mRNA splicing protein prp28 [Coemansia sp. RSA 562]KAJ2175657.1 mRNA splicing protein prp28 [Coemansia sp. RSA 560]KAJ2181575.1 mRNA splicing protein prp28 [Coemansia sp. RSA 551]KAJ2190665.1 mRNA splicing protein prp28 [Coemansia sp. RSA 532]KAJ2198795.1 mRNA splicing protein prp28 [Coemansia sp. RSA 530]KAJ2200291.1 mRNA splicing protein prp28 [Coemansia sp. RS